MEQLPLELINLIAVNLDIKSLIYLTETCKYLYNNILKQLIIKNKKRLINFDESCLFINNDFFEWIQESSFGYGFVSSSTNICLCCIKNINKKDVEIYIEQNNYVGIFVNNYNDNKIPEKYKDFIINYYEKIKIALDDICKMYIFSR
jgi:hypothetical protein